MRYIILTIIISFSSGLYGLDTITNEQYEKLSIHYQNLMNQDSISKLEAKLFINSLLKENWSLGSDESKAMAKWADKISKNANIDLRTLMPDKVEVPDSIYAATKLLVKNTLISASISLGTALILTPLTGGSLTIPMLATAFASGAIGSSISTLIDLSIILESKERLPLIERSIIGGITHSSAPSKIAPTIFASPEISLPSMVTIIPYIGKYLAEATVPGWAVIIAYGIISGAQTYIVEKVQKSPQTYHIIDSIKKMFQFFPESIDIEFEESDIYT